MPSLADVAFWAGVVVAVVAVAMALWWRAEPVVKRFPKVDVEEERVTKQGFSMKKVPADIDVIVVGSGMGGLTTAAFLAKEGKRVLVLEQHTMAGGNTHTFDEQGFEFDTGLHYIGGKVGIKGSKARNLWDYATDEGVEWARLEDVYDRAILRASRPEDLQTPAAASGGSGSGVGAKAAPTPTEPWEREEFEMHTNIKKTIADLQARFPDDAEAVAKFFELVRYAEKHSFQLWALTKILPQCVAPLVRCLNPKAFALLNKTTAEVLADLTNNAKLRGVLSYSYGDFGDSPARSTFPMTATLAAHWIGGAYYPVGGPGVIPQRMVRVVETYGGGRVLVRAPVTSIVVEGGRAVGVVVKGKHTIRAPVVISSVGAPLTLNRLLPTAVRDDLFAAEAVSLQRPEVASDMSLMSMFVGVNGDVDELQLPRHNRWVFSSWNHDAALQAYRADPVTAPMPASFISFSSAKDPTYATRHPGKQTALVIGPSFYEHVERFKDARVGKRGEEYEALKKVLQDKLMCELLTEFPQLEGRIAYAELGTGVTNDFYLGNYRGAVYGLAHTPARFALDWLRPKTKLPGFYMTGQDTLTCGISGGVASAVVTTAQLSVRFLLKRGIHFM